MLLKISKEKKMFYVNVKRHHTQFLTFEQFAVFKGLIFIYYMHRKNRRSEPVSNKDLVKLQEMNEMQNVEESDNELSNLPIEDNEYASSCILENFFDHK